MRFLYATITDNMFKDHPIEEPDIDENISFSTGKPIDTDFNNGNPLIIDILESDGRAPGHVYNSGTIHVVSQLFVGRSSQAEFKNFQLFPAILVDKEFENQWEGYHTFIAIGLMDTTRNNA